MTTIVPLLVVGFFVATVVAPYIADRRRKAAARRRELLRCGGPVDTRPTPGAPPIVHWTRDPSPTPRRKQDA